MEGALLTLPNLNTYWSSETRNGEPDTPIYMESDHACTSKQTKTIDFGSIFHRKKKTEDKRTNEPKTFDTF